MFLPGRISRTLALLAVVAVLATAAGYLTLLQQQDRLLRADGGGVLSALQGAPTWLLAVLALAVVVDAVAVVSPFGRWRRTALLVTAAPLLGAGLLGIFSIGLGLLIASGLTFAAGATDPGRARRPAATLAP